MYGDADGIIATMRNANRNVLIAGSAKAKTTDHYTHYASSLSESDGCHRPVAPTRAIDGRRDRTPMSHGVSEGFSEATVQDFHERAAKAPVDQYESSHPDPRPFPAFPH